MGETKYFQSNKLPSQRRVEPEKDSLFRQIGLIFLALVPAFLLGFLLIHAANTATQKYKQAYPPDEYGLYFQEDSQSQPSTYWHYLQKLELVRRAEEQRQEQSESAFEQVRKDWENQKELLELQQEQQKQEQQRIRMLLKQFKAR